MIAAAAEAALGQAYPAPALYVVATPIGNLADLTLRAIHVLGLVDALACEDTRVGGRLLAQLGHAKPLIALHRHNEHAAAQAVLARLRQGQRVAYASDAGTPGVSDPGAFLVATVAAHGLRAVPIPGPSSVVAAISAAGDARATEFGFGGFLPARGPARAQRLQVLLARPGAQVLFEAPHRIEALAHSLAALAPQRQLTLCRELTKQFETIATLAAADLPGWLAADPNRTRGEFVLVLHAPADAADDDAERSSALDRMLGVLCRELPLKQAVALAAEISRAPRNTVYARALELRARAPGSSDAATGEDARTPRIAR